MRLALLLLATSLSLGCSDLVGMARAHAFGVAESMGGVDSTRLMIPVRAPVGYPSWTTNPFAMRALLHHGQFAALDSFFTAAADSAHVDYRNESRLYTGYEAFENDTSLAGPLDRWVQARPASAPARIARAAYLANEAWRARGTAYAKDTPAGAIERMNGLLAQATRDLESAAAMTPRSAAAYRLRLQIGKVKGDPFVTHQYLTQGLADIPASYGMRRQYLRNLIPRWGGTHDAMRAFAQESQALADRNPRLHALLGFVDLDSAEVLEIQGNQSAALALYTTALTYGDEFVFHLERGQLLVRMGRNADALPDLDTAVAMVPTDGTAYVWRGAAREALAASHPEMPRQALADYQRAVLLEPEDTDALDRFAILYGRVH
jgi:tetratricopeptide (TPR) repeat protein